MSEAAELVDEQALCELAAQTIARLEGTTALVHVRDARADPPLLWSAVAARAPGPIFVATGPSPTPAADAPQLILAELEDGAQQTRTGVPARALGLEGEALCARLDALKAGSFDAVSAWVGVVSDPRAPSHAAREEDELPARLVARHLVAALAALGAETRRKDAEFKYRTLVEQIPAITYYRDLDKPGSATFMSPQVEDILGYPPERFINNREFFVACLHPDDRERVIASQTQLARSGSMMTTTASFEYRAVHREGHTVWLMNRVLATCDAEGKPRFLIGIIFDITETKQLEQQYLHAQKMEAVGRLASGIAHDFNNILAVIMGYGEFVLEALDPSTESVTDMQAVLDAAERARLLVAQLLAFSRPQTPNMSRLRLGEVLDSMHAMVSRVLRDDIEFEFVEDPELGSTLANRGQLEQIIMNLLVNARDAMPEGGRLRVEARNLTLDEVLTSACEPIPPGDYVMFCVTDSGVGMDVHTVQRLFEPFFTTKTQGTGLGMSTVLGLVRQHGGTLGIDSERGRGTSVCVYLPRCSEAPGRGP